MTDTGDGCDCKVGRVSEEYQLEGLDAELIARRTPEEGRPASLRTLAEHFNQAVLREAVERTGAGVLDGEVENLYRLLTDDDVSRGMRTRARKQLESDAVDLESVEASFVSHPTIGRHLEECLGVEPSASRGERTSNARDRIFKMHSRTEAVVANTLEGLAAADLVAAGDLAVTVDVRVTCQQCGVHAEAGAFIDRGGCDCDLADRD